MKKTIQLILGIIAMLGIIGIAKNSLFTDSNTDFYEKGWDAYEKEKYEAAIFYLKHVNKEKYQNLRLILGHCYVQIDNFDEAIPILQEA